MTHGRLTAPDIVRVRTFVNSPLSFPAANRLLHNVEELYDAVKELQKAVNSLQTKEAFALRTTIDGLPLHGELCAILGGQFLEITQEAGAPNDVLVRHGLRRVPQGCIIIKSPSFLEPLIDGDAVNTIPPASDKDITFRLNGSIGDRSYVILI